MGILLIKTCDIRHLYCNNLVIIFWLGICFKCCNLSSWIK